MPTEFKEPAPLAAAERAALNNRIFAAAWDLIDKKYFDDKFNGVDWLAMRIKYAPAAAAATDDDALYRVLNQMVGELRDAHVDAISPREVHEGRSRHKADPGLWQRRIEGQWVVIDTIPGSPAEAAGVRRGWLTVSRNEQPMPTETRRDSFLTHVGEPIRYVFVDADDRPRALQLVPDLIPFERARLTVSRDVAGGVRYLRFDFFELPALRWLNRELKSHHDAPDVILDLRNNSGGQVNSLRHAVRDFFPQGALLGQTVTRTGKSREMGTLSFSPALYNGRVVILTSETTASCAEIFSHVLQFHKRAIVVGEKTRGIVEGGIQHPLPGDGYLKVAELDYLGLDGRRLEGVGVTPDLLVPLTLADLRAGRDAGLDAALSWLRDNPPKK